MALLLRFTFSTAFACLVNVPIYDTDIKVLQKKKKCNRGSNKTFTQIYCFHYSLSVRLYFSLQQLCEAAFHVSVRGSPGSRRGYCIVLAGSLEDPPTNNA